MLTFKKLIFVLKCLLSYESITMELLALFSACWSSTISWFLACRVTSKSCLTRESSCYNSDVFIEVLNTI